MWKPRTTVVAACAALAACGLAYWPVLTKLVHDWAYDGNYSHGFIIAPLAGYFAWERRERLRRTPAAPAVTGLALVLAGLGLLLIGRLGADLFLTRVSLVAVLVGALAYLRGWQTVALLKFPLAFLLLMIPIPAIIFNQIAFPLQLVASSFGASVVAAAGVPVLREGNLIVLARTTLEVAEACSGIRSLVSLLTLGITYGYLIDDRTWVRTVVALLTIPLAVVANGLRVAGTGLAAQYWGTEAAEGFLHTFSGWLVFVLAFGLLSLAAHLLVRAAPPRGPLRPARAATT
ncbi:MAG TPA: exosortase A [Vicinamibacterales bacterium]|jgi:exosortase|nr:exosortase A [Vicinamibacterales bacterium]